jgi:hypothetical protein
LILLRVARLEDNEQMLAAIRRKSRSDAEAVTAEETENS